MTATVQPARWSAATIALHWLSAILIIGLLALGLTMVHIVAAPAQKFDLYQVHKSFGFVALALLALRLIARSIGRAPAPPPGPAWARRAAAAMHATLYCLTLIAIFSGWATASATIIPVPIRFFRTFVIPNIVASSAALEQQMSLVHTAATWTMLALVVLHAAAAIKHAVIDRDDVLRRMAPHWLASR